MGFQIAIAGAGIGGLAAGAALARDGHDVTVFDRFDVPRPVGSGLVIQPVGQAVLRAVGALDAATARGQVIDRLVGTEAESGRRVLDVAYDPSGQGARHGLAIHRAALFQALLEMAQAAGARVVASSEIAGVTEAPKRRLRLAGGQSIGPFDLIVDAAGAGSPLSPLTPRALPYGAIWGTVEWPADTDLPSTQLTQSYRSARHMLGVLPVGLLPGAATQKSAIFWSLPRRGLADWQNAPIEAWKAQAAALWPDFAPFLAGIGSHSDMTPAFYNHGTLRTPVRRGLIHIGDAAHQASPQLGQGANMALLDAWALAVALRAHPGDLPAALAQCWHMRRWHLRVYQLMSGVLTPMYQSDSRALPMLRDHVLTPLSRLRAAQALLARLVCGDLIAPLRGTGSTP